jgi:Txe/YoeB family toxin of Txe-Axe toxin-antitoxin module
VSKTNENTSEDAVFDVYNIVHSNDLDTRELNEWAENGFPEFVDSPELLEKYLGYSKFVSVFSSDFLSQLFEWKELDYDVFKYILLLMKDVELHPFTGGRGQTENLRGRGKEASKRINNSYPDGDRLSYTIENDVVTFIACKGHYAFH